MTDLQAKIDALPEWPQENISHRCCWEGAAAFARLALARTVVERLLSTRNAEAKALTLLEVAQNNYADHRAELAEYEKASVAASQAEADARALLKAMEVPHE